MQEEKEGITPVECNSVSPMSEHSTSDVEASHCSMIHEFLKPRVHAVRVTA